MSGKGIIMLTGERTGPSFRPSRIVSLTLLLLNFHPRLFLTFPKARGFLFASFSPQEKRPIKHPSYLSPLTLSLFNFSSFLRPSPFGDKLTNPSFLSV